MNTARPHWWPAYVGIGSNLDSPIDQVTRAIDALAKIPQRGIVKAVRKMDSEHVLKVLLRNPMLVEEDVLFILHRTKRPSPVFDAVAKAPRWRQRPAVCYEIIRHPHAPPVTAMRLLASMPQKDLREIASNSRYPQSLRGRARKLYVERRAGR